MRRFAICLGLSLALAAGAATASKQDAKPRRYTLVMSGAL